MFCESQQTGAAQLNSCSIGRYQLKDAVRRYPQCRRIELEANLGCDFKVAEFRPRLERLKILAVEVERKLQCLSIQEPFYYQNRIVTLRGLDG